LPAIFDQPHRRWNPLAAEWVLVSPHRTRRPWQGQVEPAALPAAIPYDANCYLCPGNARAGGISNPSYEDTFVFENDYAALLPSTPEARVAQDDLLIAESESGVCRVMCFAPRHDLTLARMEPAAIVKVIQAWMDQYRELGGRSDIGYVQIFENRGEMMGASNPHPHCQIWASRGLPNEPAKEQQAFSSRGSCLLCDYVELELRLGERVVCRNEHFVTIVPYWALWPFETIVLPLRHYGSMSEMTREEMAALADILKRTVTRYDNLFEISFPYSMGFHQTPTDGQMHPEWHFHGHYYPPLLRSASVRKFMVGYEMVATPQRDITAESAAGRLGEMSERHYTTR
jgi:UDPglucose--hexose-1-phosphate uridylyltransferase